MAKKNNRDYLGIEISEEYIDIINNRICYFQNQQK
jgi:DNA modification methylase